MKQIHVHAKEFTQEHQRKKDECNPTQSPEARIQLKALPRIPYTDRLIHQIHHMRHGLFECLLDFTA